MTRQLFLTALLLLAACGAGDGKGSLATATIDTLPGGIVRVTNSGPTQWADTNGWQLVEERSITPPEGSPGEIGNPGGIAADLKGNVYLMQTDPVGIKVYGPDGTWLRTIGRDGDGPGEFRNGMFALVGDVLVVQDPNNTRMTTFRTTGEFLGTVVSQCCWWSSNFPVFDDGTIGITGPPPANHSDRQGAMYVTAMNGAVTDTVLLPVRKPPGMQEGMWTVTRKSGTSTSMMGVGIPLHAGEVSAYFPSPKKVLGNTAEYTLAITDLRGDTTRLFSAPVQRLGITDLQRDSIFEATVGNVSEAWREPLRAAAKKGDIPSIWPAWSRIKVDANSNIWIGRPGPRGAVSVLDVFSPDGILLGSVNAPTDGIFNGYWTADHIYLQDSDDAGMPRIRIFKIVKSG